MTQPSQAPFADYTFSRPGFIHNLVFDDLGEAVFRIHNERFKGTPIEDTTNYEPNQPLSFSNTPRMLNYHHILETLTQRRIPVVHPIDDVHHWSHIPERDTTYADFNGIPLFPNPGPNEDLRTAVLRAFGKTATTVPLWAVGFQPVKAGNNYGFTLQRTDFSELQEAPWLTKDQRVKYDPATKSLVPAQADETGVQIYVPADQSGLRWAYRFRGISLNCGGERLLISNACGRVQVVQKDPKGRAKK